MKKRLFLAFPLPEIFKADLISYQELLAGNFGIIPFGPRFTPAENLHITVSFLGFVDEKDVANISAAVANISAQYSPILLEFQEVRGRPEAPKKRMLWAVFKENPEFIRLKKSLNKGLKKYAPYLNKEKRKEIFIHITLARLKIEGRIDSLPPPEIHQGKISCEKILLFESRLRSSGPVYTVIEEFPLSLVSHQV